MLAATGYFVGIAAYLALFFAVGLVFVFVNLLIGRFVRPADPHPEKLEIYECGEPTIGSSFVQFDLRFYVVALLFIIFDVEVAFFFPWAAVFGKSTHLQNDPVVATTDSGEIALTANAAGLYRELGVRDPAPATTVPKTLAGESGESTPVVSAGQARLVGQQGARQLVWITVADIGVFFAVLLVGFAYVWKRGDLDWVRAISPPESQVAGPQGYREAEQQPPVLSA